jgi:hypothetical protein
LHQAWSELFGDQCLSVSKENRQTNVPSACRSLDEYIEKWQTEERQTKKRKTRQDEDLIEETES